MPGVGSYTAQQLIAGFGSVSQIWQQDEEAWLSLDGVGPKLVQALKHASSDSQSDSLSALMEQCDNSGIDIICPGDDVWPQGLRACSDAPLILFVKGNLQTLKSEKILGMVGARKASAEGKLITRRWSSYCSRQGVCIISGMAPGIDSAAHGGSLDAEKAGIAVLGYGLLAGSAQQVMQIDALADLGCVISEYQPQMTAKAGYFPQRNRLIAGIAHGLVVVEGGMKSGSLITAQQALNYGREVFAVPGSVLNDVHAGCHQLIKDGAALVTDAEEILQYMHWQHGKSSKPNYRPATEIEEKIISCLSHQVMHVDSLAEDCRLTVPALSTILLRLELQGVIEKLPGSRYTLS